MFNLNDKVIIITGASSGIGRSCAILAAEYGATVILIGRNKERLEEVYNKLKKGNHLCYTFDITRYNEIEENIEEIVTKVGKIHGFVHSAGIEATKPLQVMKPEVYENIFATNVIAGLEIAKIISKNKYISPNQGSFVFISSVMGLVGQKGKVAYCGSKAALIGATRALALELAQKNIRANCISPGLVKTEMTEQMFKTLPLSSQESILNKHPLGLGEPIDIAYSCLFLLSDLSKWITGSNLVIDGGYLAS